MIFRDKKKIRRLSSKKIKSCKKSSDFFEINLDQATLLEQDTAYSIIKDSKIDFAKEYYQIHYLPQTAEQIEVNKNEKILKNY